MARWLVPVGMLDQARVLQDFGRDVMGWMPRLLIAVVIVLGAVLGGLIVRRLLLRLSRQTEATTAYIVRLAGRISAAGLMVFGVVTALGTIGVDVSALVAGLGLTGFALGFGLKDILANVVSGVLILLYRPFALYDRIIVAGLEGVVSEIDLRYTRLEQEDKTFLVPNSLLITNTITLLKNRPPESGSSSSAA